MKKTIITMICLLVVGLLAVQGVVAETFDVSATIPSATTVVFITSRVQDEGEFTVLGQGSQAMNFTTAGEGIEYDAVNGIWSASRFFAVDVSPQTAGGDPAPASFDQIDISYEDDENPNGGNAGLEAKGVVTVVRVDTVPGVDEDTGEDILVQSETQIVADTFGNIASANVINDNIAGGFMRAYVGISTGEAGKPGVPFTNGDAPGIYSGTLTITATLN